MQQRPFVVVPFAELSPDALNGLLEAYASREGTDYGHTAPPTLEEKTAQIRRQLETGYAVIVYDPEDQTCNIMPRHDLPPEALSAS